VVGSKRIRNERLDRTSLLSSTGGRRERHRSGERDGERDEQRDGETLAWHYVAIGSLGTRPEGLQVIR
jgi:hypothetical protein